MPFGLDGPLVIPSSRPAPSSSPLVLFSFSLFSSCLGLVCPSAGRVVPFLDDQQHCMFGMGWRVEKYHAWAPLPRPGNRAFLMDARAARPCRAGERVSKAGGRFEFLHVHPYHRVGVNAYLARLGTYEM